jgi:hypothetical protein
VFLAIIRCRGHGNRGTCRILCVALMLSGLVHRIASGVTILASLSCAAGCAVPIFTRVILMVGAVTRVPGVIGVLVRPIVIFPLGTTIRAVVCVVAGSLPFCRLVVLAGVYSILGLMAVMGAPGQIGRLVSLVLVAPARVTSALMRCSTVGAGGIIVFGVMVIGRLRFVAVVTAAGRGLGIGAGCAQLAFS